MNGAEEFMCEFARKRCPLHRRARMPKLSVQETPSVSRVESLMSRGSVTIGRAASVGRGGRRPAAEGQFACSALSQPAMAIVVRSCRNGPITWAPMGSPPGVRPIGAAVAGRWAKVATPGQASWAA